MEAAESPRFVGGASSDVATGSGCGENAGGIDPVAGRPLATNGAGVAAGVGVSMGDRRGSAGGGGLESTEKLGVAAG
jgi:hypothetical protein